MTEAAIQKLLDIGVSLSAEKDYNRLLEQILSSAMDLAGCEAGTLYLKDADALNFCITYNHKLKTYQGGDGIPPNLPPVKIDRTSVCALSLLENRIICVDDVYSCGEYDLSGPLRYDALTGYRTVSMLVVPMRNRDGEVLGVLQLINALNGTGEVIPFQKKAVGIIKSVASQAAVSVQNMRYVEAIQELLHSFVQVLSCAIDERTPYNVSHTKNMVRYGEKFLDYINRNCKGPGAMPIFSPIQREEFMMSIWLHDIGKLVTPLEVMNKASRLPREELERIMRRLDVIKLTGRINRLEGEITKEQECCLLEQADRARTAIRNADQCNFLEDEQLCEIGEIASRTYVDTDGTVRNWLFAEELEKLSIRCGTLTEEERKIMQNHVAVTAKMLAEISFSEEYKHVPLWASSHHELLNGSGYPAGISGKEIPYEVRILTILDIFDALTADDRPYKPGLPVERALSILEEMAVHEGKLDVPLTNLFIQSRCWETDVGMNG